jgi:hypothetical protein
MLQLGGLLCLQCGSSGFPFRYAYRSSRAKAVMTVTAPGDNIEAHKGKGSCTPKSSGGWVTQISGLTIETWRGLAH